MDTAPRITIHGNPGIIQPQTVPGSPSTPPPPHNFVPLTPSTPGGRPDPLLHSIQTIPEPSVTLALLVLVITIAFSSLGSRKAKV
jgi:hypothetical protein